MNENLQKLKKILNKNNQIKSSGELGIVKELVSIEDKIQAVDSNVKDISGEITDLKKEIQSIPRIELSDIPVPKDGKDGINGLDGEDGDDYVLTEQDKIEIAKSIKVPVVEKIIEKTEVIHEQPIVTNTETIKEVAVPQTGEQIVDKINELSTDEENQIDVKHIKGLGAWYNTIKNSGKEMLVGGIRFLSQLFDIKLTDIQNGDTLAWDSVNQVWVNAVNSSTDEKVKYNASDASAGYLADKVVAGTGITLSEGTGGNADKLEITNTLDLTNYFNKAVDDTDDITDTASNRFTDDTAISRLANTSGTNTGDNATNSQYSGLEASKVPYTGATSDVDLGSHNLETQGLHVKGAFTNYNEDLRDMGYVDTSDLRGYGSDYIVDKTLNKVKIGANGTAESGGIRVVNEVAQMYLNSAWATLVTNFTFREDSTYGYTLEHQPTGFQTYIEIMTGQSLNSLGLNGLPIINAYKVSMGAYPVPSVIGGRTII